MEKKNNTLKKVIKVSLSTLTPKEQRLAEFVLDQPQKAVFMTTRQLAGAVGVSEATVVRFVRHLGYESYSMFIRHLRTHIDTGLTLMERNRIIDKRPDNENGHLKRVIQHEIDNLKYMCNNIDTNDAEEIIEIIDKSSHLFIIGSRLSYSPAYYMGWAMTKIRNNISILSGSDRTAIDWLAIAPENSVVVMVAMSRYPNELIRIGKMARRSGHALILLTDSRSCPLIQFSNKYLIAPMRSIPFLGSPTAMSCLINYLVHALAEKRGDALKTHQEKLEQAYWENDVLFNLDT